MQRLILVQFRISSTLGHVARNPGDDERLREGDTVIVLGHRDDLPELRRRYELERQTFYRGARVQ